MHYYNGLFVVHSTLPDTPTPCVRLRTDQYGDPAGIIDLQALFDQIGGQIIWSGKTSGASGVHQGFWYEYVGNGNWQQWIVLSQWSGVFYINEDLWYDTEFTTAQQDSGINTHDVNPGQVEVDCDTGNCPDVICNPASTSYPPTADFPTDYDPNDPPTYDPNDTKVLPNDPYIPASGIIIDQPGSPWWGNQAPLGVNSFFTGFVLGELIWSRPWLWIPVLRPRTFHGPYSRLEQQLWVSRAGTASKLRPLVVYRLNDDSLPARATYEAQWDKVPPVGKVETTTISSKLVAKVDRTAETLGVFMFPDDRRAFRPGEFLVDPETDDVIQLANPLGRIELVTSSSEDDWDF